MSLLTFRDLLLQKTEDTELHAFINELGEDLLQSLLVESLQKAESSAKGSQAGHALQDFGVHYNEPVDTLVRDALSHHASRYKAALKANRPDIANKHMDRYMSTMNILKKAQKKSGGTINVEAIDPKPWERNLYLNRKTTGPEAGQFSTDTVGFKRTGANWHQALTQAPHESYAGEVKGHGHAGAYPLEKNKVNGKNIHIKDIDPSTITQFEPHPFDSHPIFKYHDNPTMSEEQHTARANQYDADKDKYLESTKDARKNIIREHGLQKAENPEEYNKRHTTESPKVHNDVEPLDFETAMARGEGLGNKGRQGRASAKQMSPEDKAKADTSIADKIAAIRSRREPSNAESKTNELSPAVADIFSRFGVK